jgi:hypothetical protein
MQCNPAPKRLPKLSGAERHKRFVDMAREVEASENPKDFDEAFKKVASPRKGHCSNKSRKISST